MYVKMVLVHYGPIKVVNKQHNCYRQIMLKEKVYMDVGIKMGKFYCLSVVYIKFLLFHVKPAALLHLILYRD